ncbi:MAG: glycosyltransferase family 2 protein [Chloroflexi bacterium]|nr:glycosyltransferase family 2 protein [Chloroflexota bacterium]
MRQSVTAFFPCFNDASTIGLMVTETATVLERMTDDFEVIVVNDGSRDNSAEVLAELQRQHQYLRVITHDSNRGYGGALRSGFAAARKDLIFYTDGDAQYDPREVARLHELMTDNVDVVQGWKIERGDAWHRKFVGGMYQHGVRRLFGLKVRDVDCDFRLIRRQVLNCLSLTRNSGSITVELMARIEQAGFNIVETPVHHYPRPYGSSQFFNPRRVAWTLWQLAGLWLGLRWSPTAGEPIVGGVAAIAE